MEEDSSTNDQPTEEKSKRPSIFKSPAASIKTLRRSYKTFFKFPNEDKFKEETEKESDRSLVILIAAILDDYLTYLLSQSLSFEPTDDELDTIFRLEGPLGTFSSRMEIARLFGIITDVMYEQLNVIREMRNACAHSKHSISFADPTLANVTKRLFDIHEKAVRYSSRTLRISWFESLFCLGGLHSFADDLGPH